LPQRPQSEDGTVPAEGMLHSPSILLAEDGATVALHAQTLLERWGYAVLRTGCDAAAVAAIGEGGYDLVVIGAGAGAAGVASACSGLGASNSLPFIALEQFGNELHNAVATVRLPINPPELRAAVEQCLAARGAINHAGVASMWGSTANAMFLRVARVFIGELNERLSKLATLLPDGNAAAIELEAHAIKGAASSVCAGAVEAAAARLETGAEGGDPASLQRLLSQLQAAAAQAVAALERIIEGNSGK
jgi:HPt (histidine-containing phosphotransfer) domain-containing protein